MAKASKSSKKFAKKHLKAAIVRRRKLKPMRNASRRKHVGPGLDNKLDENSKHEPSSATTKDHLIKKKVEDMDVDDLMNGNFLDETDFNHEDFSSGCSDGADDDISSLQEFEDEDNDLIVSPEDVEVSSQGWNEEVRGSNLHADNEMLLSEVGRHKKELQRLQEKDPEFFEFLKEHDKELLEFEDEEEVSIKEEEKASPEVQTPKIGDSPEVQKGIRLSSTQVDVWCKAIKEKEHLGAVRNILRAFQSACHYGDEVGETRSTKFNIDSSHVFNKIMVFVLSEMDAVFKKLFHQYDGEGTCHEKDLTAQSLQKNVNWKKLEPLVKSYLGNALHVLNQMTDNQMITFTLRRLKASIVFLGAFTRLANKYLKTALHFWGSGEGALPVVAFVFLRDMGLQLGTNYLEACLKGIYKEYAANSRFVNATSLPHIHFMCNCVVELFGMDFAVSYQHAFVFIRQMAIILRNGLTMKTKEAFKTVYSWQFLNSLILWVKVVSNYCGKEELQPLVYPLAQIIGGVARLLPTAHYFPLRLHCAILLNRLSLATSSFTPVASLLLDMLQFKELNKPPTGGVGKAIDFATTLKVPKAVLKTRAFQEGCIFAVMEQLTEHLSQWSYSIAFPELAFIPLLQLRHFMKQTGVDRFKRQVKQLIEQVERNIEFVNKIRDGVSFSPKDFAAESMFLQDEKRAGASPLSQYSQTLRQLAEERRRNIHGSSMLVRDREHTVQNVFDDGEATKDELNAEKVFSSDWLPDQKNYIGLSGEKLTVKNSVPEASEGIENDVIEDLSLCSDDEEMLDTTKLQRVASSEDETKDTRSPALVNQKKKWLTKNKWQTTNSKVANRARRMKQKTT